MLCCLLPVLARFIAEYVYSRVLRYVPMVLWYSEYYCIVPWYVHVYVLEYVRYSSIAIHTVLLVHVY